MIRRSRSGFTVVELLTVVAIVAILAALAVPSFRDFFEKARLRGAADDALALLVEARQSAVKQNKEALVRFSGVGNGVAWCAGGNFSADPAVGAPIAAAAACDCNAPATCSLRTISSANYVGVSRFGNNPEDIRIDPKMGTITPLGQRLMVFRSSTGRFQLAVIVDPIGHARICRVGGSQVITGYPEC